MTPLHIELALHYHCKAIQHERLHAFGTVRDYAEDLVTAGMLEREGDGYRKTDGLAVFVMALCATPFPVKHWVMPTLAEPTAPR